MAAILVKTTGNKVEIINGFRRAMAMGQQQGYVTAQDTEGNMITVVALDNGDLIQVAQPPHLLIGKPCLLTDLRCGGQVAIASEVRPAGMRFENVGVVPHNEYREATEEEYQAWLSR